ncbi:hexokinase family protein-like protein [Xylogone sp. PMI_703]|nr:hexokinase family protein-like protein [Xylogone sp. PMI_703]
MAPSAQSLEDFLQPLAVDVPKLCDLSRRLCETYNTLAATSQAQFLPTPISDSILRPSRDSKGRYLAIDIGGTNLRVGFIELLGDSIQSSGEPESRVRRLLERSWPIGEQLKNEKPEDLFAWIGKCIAEVISNGLKSWGKEIGEEIPMGVTFSFPMIQESIDEATLMPMGKDFAITSNLELHKMLQQGYDKSRTADLPRIRIAAITNDTVATLVSFAYQLRVKPGCRAAMGLVVGTGCNATIPLSVDKLNADKLPKHPTTTKADRSGLKITVNTEWTISGASAPLHELNVITKWDKILDAEGLAPGFQPFEYLTAGRYLGELGRIIILDYLLNVLRIPEINLPPKLRQKYGLTTTFLGNLGPHLSSVNPSMLGQLETELPSGEEESSWHWTAEIADDIYRIAKSIEVRAAGLVAAAIVGLLGCADEINLLHGTPSATSSINGVDSHSSVQELMVGYTGGCISHFQDYLSDCQRFLDQIIESELGLDGVPRVVLRECNDGGIIGAGILAGTVSQVQRDTEERTP